MRKPIYPYRKCHEHLYEFVSKGEARIVKHVEFIPTDAPNIVSVGFGDLLESGELGDMANSNNGDLSKVMATIVKIIKEYIENNPSVKIYFQGSTAQRTRLYGRILKNYYKEFTAANFLLTAITTENLEEEVAFDPSTPYIYQVFLIQKNSNFTLC